MEIDYILIDNYTGWVQGIIYKGKEVYEFQAKVSTPSKYGINKGRISKLWIYPREDRGTWLVNYDRGWDIKPSFGLRGMFKKLVESLEALPHHSQI
jgi:hypothetical protein